jgi:hypothetical protein
VAATGSYRRSECAIGRLHVVKLAVVRITLEIGARLRQREYRPGDGSIGDSYGNQNLDWVGAPHLCGAVSGPYPGATVASIGVRRNEVVLTSNKSNRRR